MYVFKFFFLSFSMQVCIHVNIFLYIYIYKNIFIPSIPFTISNFVLIYTPFDFPTKPLSGSLSHQYILELPICRAKLIQGGKTKVSCPSFNSPKSIFSSVLITNLHFPSFIFNSLFLPRIQGYHTNFLIDFTNTLSYFFFSFYYYY